MDRQNNTYAPHAAPWQIVHGAGPLVAVALHHGHMVRPEVAKRLVVSEADRLREEDPYTGQWTPLAPTRIVALRSRFEVDLNRPPERAVYLGPDDAWGLRLFEQPLPEDVLERSRELHRAFYREAAALLDRLVGRFGHVVVFDLHSYNFRRDGPDAPPAAPADDPEINLGTSNMDREYWAPVVDRFFRAISEFEFLGRRLCVRENVRFNGGYFSRWAHQRYPRSVCSLAVEVKKFFMDEWTGRADAEKLGAVRDALRAAARQVVEVRQPGT